MKKKLSAFLYIIVAAVTVFAGVPTPRATALGNALLFSPNNAGTMNVGATFTVNVRAYVESGAPTGQVAGTVLYQPNLVKVIATSASGSTYGTPAIIVGGSTIGFSGSTSPGPSGLTNVFSITFQTVGGGSGSLSFSGDSTINGAPATRNTASYAVNAPAPTPTTPVTPKPTPTQPTTPVTPTVPTPPPTPVATPPTPTEVEDNTTEDTTGVIEDPTTTVSYNSATVNWKHSKPQESTALIYGATRTSMANKALIVPQGDGSYTATLLGLTPGVRYYYSITSTDANKKTSTWDSVVIAKGYPVTIAVTENEQPSANAVVRIDSVSRTTGKDGNATVELAAGNYNATITTESKITKNVSFTVISKTVPIDGKAPESQKYSFNLESESQEGSGSGNASILTFLLVLFGGGAVIVMGVLGYLAYRRRQYDSGYGDTSYTAAGPSIVIDDGYNWQQQNSASPPSYPYPPSSPPPPPPPPPMSGAPTVNDTGYEEPKDMFELAREREARLAAADQQQPPKQQ